MPIHVGELTSEVTMFDGELPLSEAQLDKLVARVLERLDRRRWQAERAREATTLRPRAMPPLGRGE